MAGYTYPVRHLEGDLSADELHLILKNTTIVGRRLAELTKEKFIADFLLSGRYDATGGGVYYQSGAEDLYTPEDPESIQPGGEYPLISLEEGQAAAAATVKWGQGTIITDEKITREGRQYVERALIRIGNQIIRHVDTVAWGVIASRVTTTKAASAAWAKAGVTLTDLLTVREARAELATGLDLNTVVLKSDKYAKLVGQFIDDGALPREQGNLALTGNIPFDLFGFTWATSPHVTGDDPWLVDRDQLGGMADEKILSPEFASAGATGVEASSTRSSLGEKDGWLIRGRRVTVPIVTEPLAGVKITGTGL